MLSYIGYARVDEKIFDEIYFARAAEEYLKHWYIYENTHPPLTKLWSRSRSMLFGGLAHGDNAAGLAFSRRRVRRADGCRCCTFCQSALRARRSLLRSPRRCCLRRHAFRPIAHRDARELRRIFCPRDALHVLPLLDRLADARQRRKSTVTQLRYRIVGIAACLILAIAVSRDPLLARSHAASIRFACAKMVAVIYVFAGLYLLFRGVVLPRFFASARSFTSYPEGATVKTDEQARLVECARRRRGRFRKSAAVAGDLSANDARRAGADATANSSRRTARTDRSNTRRRYATARFYAGAVTSTAMPSAFGNPRLWLHALCRFRSRAW